MIEEVEERDENNVVTIRDLNNRVDYLSIPILAKLILKRKYISPYILIGPRFDILLGYKAGKLDGVERLDAVYNQFKNNGIGADLGIGTEINVSESITTLVEFRYSHDFADAYETEFLTVRNRSYEILIGFFIPL
jgi:opacity protein-like surface antigen